tara:strand:+ start:707 stop:2452 length:1746 start_codon:yes stop_codon:yes gene_type:complete
MKEKIENILKKNRFRKYKLFLFANIINFFLEFISLISIPIFIASIISPEKLFLKIKDLEKIFGYEIGFISNENIVIYAASLAVLSFYIKNFFIGVQTFKEKQFYKNFNLSYKKFFFKHYVDMPYLLHTQKNPSELVRGTLYDVRNASLYLEHFCILARDIISLIVIFFISSLVSLTNTLAILIIFLILVFFYLKLIKPKIKKKATANQDLEKTIIKTLNETYSAIKDIIVLSKQNYIKSNFEEKIKIYEKNRFFFILSNKFPKIIMELTAISLIITISVSYYLITKDPQTLLNILSINVVLILRFIPAFNSITLSYGFLKMFTPSVNFLNNQINEIEKIGKENEIVFNKFDEKPINKNFISIEDLSYKYPDTEKLHINNFNFEINKGEMIGVTGETGSGKTTLIHLLLGLITPIKGNIFYNGKSVFKNLNTWRKDVGYISQDIFLLDSTIRENITFNQNKENEKEAFLYQCIEASKLKDKIETLPNKIDTNVGVHGLELSGGERQRIAIARTLYKNPKIIFMDEFTSALDLETEKDILQNLIKIKKEKAFVIISHKLSTLKYCDKVFNIKNGRISKINENI